MGDDWNVWLSWELEMPGRGGHGRDKRRGMQTAHPTSCHVNGIVALPATFLRRECGQRIGVYFPSLPYFTLRAPAFASRRSAQLHPSAYMRSAWNDSAAKTVCENSHLLFFFPRDLYSPHVSGALPTPLCVWVWNPFTEIVVIRCPAG